MQTPQSDLFVPNRYQHPNANQSALLAGQRIDFLWIRSSKRRTISLSIDHDGLRAQSPLRTPLSQIHALLLKKSTWIFKHLSRPSVMGPDKTAIEYAIGKRIPFLGLEMELAWHDDPNQRDTDLYKKTEQLFVLRFPIPTKNSVHELDIKRMTLSWWEQEAINHYRDRLNQFAPLIGVHYQKIRLSQAKRLWGSASSYGVISLHWKLLAMPEGIIDYVVVHELCHLHEMNHSAQFWAHVAKQLPNYQTLRKALRHQEKTLAL